MKYIYLISSVLFCCFHSFAQSGIFFDEDQLSETAGTEIVSDASAYKGKALRRSSSAPAATFFYGPYTSYKAGYYLIQFRLKVSSNVSSSPICRLDVFSNEAGTSALNYLTITPSMFERSNEWKLFTLAVHIPQNVSDLEIRGMEFVPGICDLYFDYLHIMAPDVLTIGGSGDVAINSAVGIGTTDTKGHKLAVAGTALFTKVTVKALPWADYVFNSNYRLRPLSEVEQYIKQHNHLPEVPSAAEVEKNGISIGDNQATLLKKIEELTLYVIEQEKQIKRLSDENLELKQLRTEIDALKAVIQQIKK
ncbi:hypothetical protein [Longitalea luteola]|uniref:hypothetical protein n=1 Tax=Longitalea luteola TaxID=2812563 RepID=UPI001A96C568|nr:hypothetical protein [Longitalea luteola]